MIDILIYILQGHESGGSGDPEQGCSGFRGLISFTFRGRWPSVPRERERLVRMRALVMFSSLAAQDKVCSKALSH